MKYYTIFILSILLAFSCQKDANNDNNNSNKKSDIPLEEQIAAHIEKELASGEKNDTIVLDFRFGMNKMDVYRHTKDLANKEKMYRIKKGKKTWEYVYDLRLRDAGKIRTFFDAYYYEPQKAKKGNEELYKVECLPRIDTTKHVPLDVVKEIKEIYELEYGKADFVVPNQEDKDCKSYLWINGNQHIELGCEDDKVFMYYIDLVRKEKAVKASDL